ncbi:hypothetical protein EI534_34460, partial [Pseudomonas frederiksbergensis]|nr:hypothetical protein [Pseudomonas frederiksbergensis]
MSSNSAARCRSWYSGLRQARCPGSEAFSIIATGVLPELKAVPRRRARERPLAECEPSASQGDSKPHSNPLDANGQAVFASLQVL